MRFSKTTGRLIAAIATAIMIVATVGQIGYVQSATSLQVTHDVDTNRIFVKGSGTSPEVATVHLRLDAPGPLDHIDADVMLVIDRSASFPVSQAVSHAKRIIDRLGPNDRVGVVSFATESTLDAPLTYANDTDSLIEALDDLRDEGRTAMGEGMALASDELEFSGRENVDWIQILLTDGRSNHGRDPIEQAHYASDNEIIIYAVGVGTSVNRGLLEEVSESTGGRFFSTYSDSIVNDILSVDFNDRAPVATDVEVSVTITRDFNYETAIDNPPNEQTRNIDGTLTLRWFIDEIERDETWVARYTVSADEVDPNAEINDDRSEVRYTDVRGRETFAEIPELQIDVRPTPPPTIANFDYEPKNPTTFDPITFTDDSEIVGPGDIESYLWDFGDGTTSTEQNPTHRYQADGEYIVKLTIRSNEYVEATKMIDLTIDTPPVSVRRTINTYIPVDHTILGETFEVTLNARVNEPVNGLGIDEELPTDWDQPDDIPTDGAEITFFGQDRGTVSVRFLDQEDQWLFEGEIEAGTEIEIKYLVFIPANSAPDGSPTIPATGNQDITGRVISASPFLDRSIDGETNILVTRGFDIKTVVAHWEGDAVGGNGRLALEDNPDHTISQAQLNVAKQWWESPSFEVPFTEDESGNKQRIDFRIITCLTAYHLTEISVFDPLPESQAAACEAEEN